MKTKKSKVARLLRILVVDDDPYILSLLDVALAQQGHVMRSASSVQEALLMMRTFEPHLIICDVMMPHTDGFEFMKTVRAVPHFAQTPVIFLSACNDPYVMRMGYSLGACDFLNKPFHLKDVEQSIEHVFSPYQYC